MASITKKNRGRKNRAAPSSVQPLLESKAKKKTRECCRPLLHVESIAAFCTFHSQAHHYEGRAAGFCLDLKMENINLCQTLWNKWPFCANSVTFCFGMQRLCYSKHWRPDVCNASSKSPMDEGQCSGCMFCIWCILANTFVFVCASEAALNPFFFFLFSVYTERIFLRIRCYFRRAGFSSRDALVR